MQAAHVRNNVSGYSQPSSLPATTSSLRPLLPACILSSLLRVNTAREGCGLGAPEGIAFSRVNGGQSALVCLSEKGYAHLQSGRHGLCNMGSSRLQHPQTSSRCVRHVAAIETPSLARIRRLPEYSIVITTLSVHTCYNRFFLFSVISSGMSSPVDACLVCVVFFRGVRTWRLCARLVNVADC